jgi:hypothetical protein
MLDCCDIDAVPFRKTVDQALRHTPSFKERTRHVSAAGAAAQVDVEKRQFRKHRFAHHESRGGSRSHSNSTTVPVPDAAGDGRSG